MIRLDAWAIIAFLTDDHGDGEQKAREAIGGLEASLRVESPPPDLVLTAAAIKTSWPMSYADVFAAATAIAHRAELLTAGPKILAASSALGLRARPPAY